MVSRPQKKTSSGGEHALLLGRWLSVAESQICAIEVLSEQLPKVNELLETNMQSVSENFSNLASDAQKQADEIKAVTQRANALAMEEGQGLELVEAIEQVWTLLENANEKEGIAAAKEQLQVILDYAREQDVMLKTAMHAVEKSSDGILTAIANAVVGMQFQDRVSQNLVITMDVLRAVIIYLRGSINETLKGFGDEDTAHMCGKELLLDKEFAKALIGYLKLGELQNSFIEHLLTHGYIEDPAQLGFTLSDNEVEDEDNVELF